MNRYDLNTEIEQQKTLWRIGNDNAKERRDSYVYSLIRRQVSNLEERRALITHYNETKECMR